MRFRSAVACLALALGGCGLPAAAPTPYQLEQGNSNGGVPYSLVKIDDRVTAILARFNPGGFSASFAGQSAAPTLNLSPGDVVAVTIYETGGSSLFGMPIQAPPVMPAPGVSPPPSVPTTIPPQTIEADGTVFVPFAGRVAASGKSPAQLGRDIEKLLEGKAVGPQVMVSLVSNVGNTASVGGEANRPGQIPLTLRGERLLDVIAAAGGSKYPAYETYVRLIRHGVVGDALLQRIISEPAQNVVIRPGDQIYLTRYTRTFAVLGATQKVSQYTFDTAKVTLAEALARAGGPIDTIGNPAGIYLFRYEPARIAEALLGGPLLPEDQNGNRSDFVPILYRLDLRGADGYFLAQGIQMRDKDVVLVTNAEAVQLGKALAVVRGFTGIAYDITKSIYANSSD